MVGTLSAALSAYSIDAFVAHDTIRPSSKWLGVIEDALHSCDALLAYLHPTFRESDWCDQEVGFAAARGVPVIPVCFGSDPYGFMARYHGIFVEADLSAQDLAGQIFEILVHGPETKAAMAEALVWRLENTDSFDAGRTNIDYLRWVPREAWSPELAARARQAAQENSQLGKLRVGAELGPQALEQILEVADT